MIRYASTAVAGLLLGTLLVFSCFRIGIATVHADTPALLDAGSGSAAAPPAISAVPDPAEDTQAFLSALKDAKKHGWPLAILVGAVGLLEAAAFAGKKKSIAWLAWLGKGRVSVVIGGSIAILTAGLAALTHSGSWTAAFVAIGLAGTTYWHQAGTDPAKG